jgi:hypothetical protein
MQRTRDKGFKRPASLPRPPKPALVPYAKSRTELKNLSEGQITRLILDSAAWGEVMVPILDALDEETQGKRGPKRLFTAHELEAVLLFQRVCGLRSYREARDRLAGDRDEARRLLGLAQAKQRHAQAVVHLRDGVPSEPTVSRHKTRFGEDRRLAAYTQLFECLLDEHLADPDMQEECRVLDLDGSHVLTHYRCPSKRRKYGKKQKITCPDGGYLAPSNEPGKGGDGFNLVSLTTATGLPVAWTITPINESEVRTGEALLAGDYATKVAPRLDQTKVGVLTADGGFNSPALRRLAREVGLVENIHLASHARKDSATRNATSRNDRRMPIEGYRDWFINGHRELVCRCGQGTTARVFGRNARNGKAVARLEGRCVSCGNITLTSGRWKTAQNRGQSGLMGIVRVRPGQENEIDWPTGNPLTYNDPVAAEFGRGRFGWGEGFHGALVSRFRFLKTKHWYRRGATARLDAVMTFCVMHAAAMEQRRRVRARPVSTPALGLAQAA